MRNLAGHRGATARFLVELRQAGCAPVPSVCPDIETRVAVDGVRALAGGFVLRAVRRWCYVDVRLDPPLPVPVARAVHRTPFVGAGTCYSGPPGRLGSVARVEGHAGGLPPDAFAGLDAVTHWHCDSPAAFATLVTTLDAQLAARALRAEDARRDFVRAYTTRWITECAAALDAPGAIGTALRWSLHTNPQIDPGDARVRTLRALYPEASP